MTNKLQYSVIGLGKLGASMAAAIASRGFDVIGVDIARQVVESINDGRAPVQETDLEKYIAENRDHLRAVLDHREAVLGSDISFVIVPTPADGRGAFSLQYATWAFTEIGHALHDKEAYHLVVLVSTVLPGSTRYGLLPVLESSSGKRCGEDFGLCYSPEFIALGSVIHDYLNPDFNLVGEFDRRSGDLLQRSYSEIMFGAPTCKRMSLENAELTKLALNTYVTTKITYANMLAELCERIPGGDVDVVTDAIGTDSRIGHKYLKGALGYGGPCFPRDNVALSFFAHQLGATAEVPETTHRCNAELVERFLNRLDIGLSPGMTAAVLGLAYKPHSHVVEESQGIELALRLSRAGTRVVCFDPLASIGARAELADHAVVLDSAETCLAQADVVFITTADPSFAALTAKQLPNRRITVVDFWRIASEDLRQASTVHYVAVGQGRDDRRSEERLAALWRATELTES